MKKSILLLAFGALFTSVNAQDKPGAGKIFVGGSLGFNSGTSPTQDVDDDGNPITVEETKSSIVVSPTIGYFINDGLAVGGQLMFQQDMMEGMKGGTKFGVGAFVRKYWSMADNFYFFLRWS
jgi:hypothetical protein